MATATLKVERFIQGLADPLFTTLAPQIGKVTYAKAVNIAMLIEFGKIEIRASKEVAKKQKARGFFFSTSTFEGGYGLRVSHRSNKEGP